MSEPCDRDWYVAAIQEIEDLDSPEARELLEVYADFLQAAGDPRGTLAALQLQPDGHAAHVWLAEHREQIFGPLTELVGCPPVYDRWRGGWLTELEISQPRWGPGPIQPLPDLSTLLRLPVCACLRRLHAYPQPWPDEADLPCRRSLRVLGIAGSSEGVLAFGELPRLEHLLLAGCPASLAIDAPRLRVLGFVKTSPYAIHTFLDAGLPVQRLSVELSWQPFDHDIRSLLGHAAIETLRELQLHMAEYPYDDVAIVPPPPERVIEAILEAPSLRRLEVRNFTGLGCWQEQRERIRRAFRSARGQTYV